MATHSSTLAWKTPWTEEPGGLQSTGREESGTTERLHAHVHIQAGFRKGKGTRDQVASIHWITEKSR